MTNNFKQIAKRKINTNLFCFSDKSSAIGYESRVSLSRQVIRLRSGQAALSLVFLIGGIALLVSVTMAVIAISFLNSTFAFQSANRAYANATSGAQDALLKLARTTSIEYYSAPYLVPADCASNCASVVVTQIIPHEQVEIISTATVFASTRKIKVIASIDPNNGEVSVSSWTSLDL